MAIFRRAAILFAVFIILAGGFYSIATAQELPDSTSLIVKMITGLSSGEQENIIASNGGTETSSIPALQLHVIDVPTCNLLTIIQNYQTDRRVISVEENKTRKGEAIPNDTYYGNQWALPQIAWDQVYSAVNPSGSATVAVLDTGVDAAYPELANKIVLGTSIIDSSNGLTDPNGHGTWMAGIIAANTNNNAGIAGVGYAGVKIMPVTVLGRDATGKDGDIINGIIYATEHGANIILMSFSNPGFSQNLQDAIDYAWSKNVVLVASVGNDGTNNVAFPAGDRGVIGVSATDPSDNLAHFSNYGQDVFLAAPGTGVVTIDSNNSIISISGTSASAAIVAGVAGFVRANDSTLTNGTIVGRLAYNSDLAGTQAQTGNGRINMAHALADTAVYSIEPAGANPIGSGGPYVGPYVADTQAAHITVTASPSGAIGGTFIFSYYNPGNQHKKELSSTTSNFSIYPNSNFSITSIQSPVNGHTYTGSATITGTAGAAKTNTTVTLTYAKITPIITWSNPADITYGTALSGIQLNATASVAGTFIYSPASGTLLNAGSRILHAVFTPTDTANYNITSRNVTINVQKATATVTLSNLTKTYTGSPQTPDVVTNPPGLAIAWTNAPHVSAGYYANATATVNDPNYQGSASGTFIIKAIPANCTMYVPDNYSTIQGAINAASTGCTIIVRDGTYTENINFKGKAITVVSEHGVAFATINGGASGSVVTFKRGETNSSILSGLTITNGSAPTGGGIYCSNNSSPKITNCIICNNTAATYNGGGIYCVSGSFPTIRNCTISSNHAGYAGGGIYANNSAPDISKCIIRYNTAAAFGGGVGCKGGAYPKLRNCFINANSAPRAGALMATSSDMEITNCTLSGNSATLYTSGIGAYASTVTVVDSILWDNKLRGYAAELNASGGATISITYSDIRGGHLTNHNINSDPKFISADDYHLSAASPCIDSGTTTSVTDDIAGNPRTAPYDMGCEEVR